MDRNSDNGLFGTKRVISQDCDVITILVYYITTTQNHWMTQHSVPLTTRKRI